MVEAILMVFHRYNHQVALKIVTHKLLLEELRLIKLMV